jgi:hypothetical protein
VHLEDGINDLVLEIFPEDDKLVVFENQNLISEFKLIKYKENYNIVQQIPFSVEKQSERLDTVEKTSENIFSSRNINNKTNDNVYFKSGLTNKIPTEGALQLGYLILRELKNTKFSKEWYSYSGHTFEFSADKSNLKLLANDKNFVKLIETEKRIFDNKYKEFLAQKVN